MAQAIKQNIFIDLKIRKYRTDYYNEVGEPYDKPKVELSNEETKQSITLKEALKILIELLTDY